MRGAAGRPRLLAGAEKPDGIGGEARRLGGAGNQNRRDPGFRREERFVDGAIERRKKFLPLNAPAIEAERCAFVNGLLPAAMSLEFAAGKRAIAGPAGELEQLRRQLSPCDWRLRAAREFLKPRWACVMRATQAAGNSAPGF